MRYLAIDYGKKKIGLAISEGVTASPLKILEVSSLKDALQKIQLVIKQESIDKVVIGLPESGEARKLVENFLKEADFEELTLITVPETLSSQNALNDMLNLNLSKKSRSREDAYSAAIILQDYLDSQN